MSVLQVKREELFTLAHKGQYLLYAPLRRRLALVSAGTVAAVAAFLERGIDCLTSEQQVIINELELRGFIGGDAPEPPIFPSNSEFCPHEVTLFLTSRCNLRCRYCYANAGGKCVEMPWNVARAAIDFVAHNAAMLGLEKFGLGFHGGGEPTIAWDMLVRCVEHGLAVAHELGLKAEIFCATNGVLSPEQQRYIASHFQSLNVSLDGPQDIQDYTRPMVDGSGSFHAVSESLRYFDSVGFQYGLRATVTANTVTRMTDIVESVARDFKPIYLHLEPVWQCGRCAANGETAPPEPDFVTYFIQAAERGKELGLDVTYSGSRLDMLTSKFCAAPGDGFAVTPEGTVTSCFEVIEPSDSRAEVFHYGFYDAATGQFQFDLERISRLNGFSVQHIPWCQDCFCKWHCAGDCLAKAFERSGSRVHEGSARCEINRSLSLQTLSNAVKHAQTKVEFPTGAT